MTTGRTTSGRGAAETAARRRRRTGVAVASALCVLGAGPLAVAATAAADPAVAFLTTDGLGTTPPAAPTMALTPSTAANNNEPRLAVTADAGTGLRVSRTCGGAELFDDLAAAYPEGGLVVGVDDDTTTTVYAQAVDAIGNASPCASVTYVEDSTSRTPAAPDLADTSDTGDPADDVTSVTAPTFVGASGSVEPGAEVLLYADEAETARGTATDAGSYEITVPGDKALSTGYHRITAVAIDPAGNLSAASPPLVIEVDRSTPAWTVEASTATGSISPNGDGQLDTLDLTTRFTKPLTWTWTLENATGTVLSNRAGSGQVATLSWGGVSDAGVRVPDGLYTWHLSAVDRAGTSYPDMINDAVTVDTRAPALTLTRTPATFNPAGTTSSLSVAVSGTRAEEDILVTVAVINKAGRSVRNLPPQLTYGKGILRWSWDGRGTDGKVLPDGPYRYVVRASDPAANATTKVPSAVRIDTVAPALSPLVMTTTPTAGPRSRTSVTTRVDGKATVALEIRNSGGTLVRRLVQKPAGAATLTFVWDGRTTSGTLAPLGTYQVVVTATDAAGNAGAVAGTTELRP